MNREHQRKMHKLEGEEANRRSDFFLETIVKFTVDTMDVYRNLMIKVKNKELSIEKAIEYLDKVEEQLNAVNS